MERSSKRSFAYDKSPSLIKTKSACFSPLSSTTSVIAPATSRATLFLLTSESPAISKSATRRRCGRNSLDPTGIVGASCLIANFLYTPDSISISGRNVFTPAVCNHVAAHGLRSRPLVASSSTMRSLRVVFLKACFVK